MTDTLYQVMNQNSAVLNTYMSFTELNNVMIKSAGCINENKIKASKKEINFRESVILKTNINMLNFHLYKAN